MMGKEDLEIQYQAYCRLVDGLSELAAKIGAGEYWSIFVISLTS